MKILNLYAGIGGNRKLWTEEHEVTAIEWDESTAEVYKSYFPNDNVIVTNAHNFLLENYKDYDFIWSSPPCPSHSDIRRCGVHAGQYPAIYPEMSLYEEIILLQTFAPKNTLWVVENVRPYYKPLIEPNAKLHRHYFWTNFNISEFECENDVRVNKISSKHEVYGFSVKDSKIKNKRKALRNLVNPLLGAHIIEQAIQHKKKTMELQSV